MKFKSEQEKFWAGKFGDKYINRNFKAQRIKFVGRDLLINNLTVSTILEIGPNVGHNLDAAKQAFPYAKTFGVEINKKAYKILKKRHPAANKSILDFNTKKKFDLVIITGVLSHQSQNILKKIYKKIYKLTSKYIYLADYFNPYPHEVKYRGFNDRLTKRDFAKEIWKMYPNLKLLDYGFYWKQDPHLKGQCDDVNWFLFKKNK